jgi:hypothetical protein
MEETKVSQSKLLDKYTEEWSLLQDSIQWNFSRQEKQAKYILIIVAIFFGLEEIGIAGVKLDFEKDQFWLFGSPILLVLMYRISSPMYFIRLKLNRQKEIEESINELIDNSGLGEFEGRNYPFSFQDMQFSERERKSIWKNPSVILFALVALLCSFLLLYAEIRLWHSRPDDGKFVAVLHIIIVSITYIVWIAQVFMLSKESKKMYE